MPDVFAEAQNVACVCVLLRAKYRKYSRVGAALPLVQRVCRLLIVLCVGTFIVVIVLMSFSRGQVLHEFQHDSGRARELLRQRAIVSNVQWTDFSASFLPL